MSDARLEAANIVSKAEAEADKIRRQTMECAEKIISDSLAETEKEREAELKRAKGRAAMKKREILLRAKVSLINSAYEEAKARILSMERDKYCDFLSHLLADAVLDRLSQVAHLKANYGDDEETDLNLDFTVVFNERDKAELSSAVAKNAKAIMHKRPTINVDESTADISGGLILRYGDTQTNCSVDAVIADTRRKTEAEVTRLFTSPINE